MRDALRTHFDQLADHYDQETSWRLDQDLLTALISTVPSGFQNALELGCGTGIVSSQLIKERMVGADFSIQMCREARARGIKTVQADAMRLPFSDRVYDLVVARQIFQYFSKADLRTVATELRRVARPGFRLISHHFVIPSGSAHSWWRNVKKHIQPHRVAVHTEDDIDRGLAAAGWNLQSKTYQRHRRRVELINSKFHPSVEFPTRDTLLSWIRATASREAPDSEVIVASGVIQYTQLWSLGQYS